MNWGSASCSGHLSVAFCSEPANVRVGLIDMASAGTAPLCLDLIQGGPELEPASDDDHL